MALKNLTNALIGAQFNVNYDESLKQAIIFDFEDGTRQSVGTKSITSIIQDLSYRNLTEAQFDLIDLRYRENHSNSFRVDIGVVDDPRTIHGNVEGGTWAFGEFKFTADARDVSVSKGVRYNGSIALVTSVLFDYTEFNVLFNKPSTYTASISTNTDFLDVLDEIDSTRIEYGYKLNSLVNHNGQSVSTMEDLGNAAKTWKLSFIAETSAYATLVTFFRRKGTIGIFGVPKRGRFSTSDQLIAARFAKDSFKRQKLVNGLHLVTFELEEVKF